MGLGSVHACNYGPFRYDVENGFMKPTADRRSMLAGTGEAPCQSDGDRRAAATQLGLRRRLSGGSYSAASFYLLIVLPSVTISSSSSQETSFFFAWFQLLG